MLAARSRSHLIVIDVQDRRLAVVDGGQRILENAIRLIGFARRLGIPVTMTEHDTARGGATAAVLNEAAGGSCPLFARTAYSVWRDEPLRQRIKELRQSGRDQMVLVGLEAHVSVGQSALDLLSQDLDVFVPADATTSRRSEDRDIALRRLARAGVAIATRETLAFEWLESSGTPEFTDLLPLIEG